MKRLLTTHKIKIVVNHLAVLQLYNLLIKNDHLIELDPFHLFEGKMNVKTTALTY